MNQMGQQAVILVHGLWMTGADLSLLKRRLRKAGFAVYVFSYPSVRRELAANAVNLRTFAENLREPVVNYVAHSLGGLVVRKLFAEYPDRPPGRVVTLGTPHQGSRVAASFGRSWLGRRMFGHSLACLIDPPLPAQWRHPNALGSIAGNRPFGAGRLVARLQKPHDGSVEVSSTILEGAADRLVLPVTHFSMLFSRSVAEQTTHFLRHGGFVS